MTSPEATAVASPDNSDTQTPPTQRVTPILNRKPRQQTIYVGCDDGHYGIKLCFEDGTVFYVPSRVTRGLHQIVAFDGDEAADRAYVINDQPYTVLEDYALVKAEDTRSLEPPFPVSPLNRVLVNHALTRALAARSINPAEVEVVLVTGLPVDDFYIAGQKNVALIDAKIKNLAAAQIINKNHSVVLPRITQHHVISEGIAAFFDLMLDFDGNEIPETQKMVQDRAIAIVDVGGKTTDIAMVAEGGTGLYPERSGTEPLGALNLNETVGVKLKARFKLSAPPPDKHVEAAIHSKTYSLYGEQHNIADIIDEEARDFAQKIKGYMNKCIGSGYDLGKVIFVGGGSILLRPYFEALYPKQSIFPDNPQFANARGMLKAAKFLLVNS
jgi:plasmid segregation protein ParM